MKPEEIEIAKKIAEIEGVELKVFKHSLYGERWLYQPKGKIRQEYNPFDWAILGPLMLKYGVLINYCSGSVYMSNPFEYRFFVVKFSCKDEIPLAILKCIIEACQYEKQ